MRGHGRTKATLGHRFAVARREARLWARYDMPEPGAALVPGPGLIDVYLRVDGRGWVLWATYYLDGDNTWHRRRRPGHVIWPRLPRRAIRCSGAGDRKGA